MLLAIDVGNTNILFALLDGSEIRNSWRIATDARRTSDQYAVWLHQLLILANMGFDDVDGVIIASVVPSATRSLVSLSQNYCGVEPHIAGKGEAQFEINVDLPDPSAVGADRLVNAIAAHAKWQTDLIIIDFGTATTFDIVDYSGSYSGGVIAPGINLSLDALVQATAQLPRIAIQAPADDAKIIGKNTVQAMHSGIYWGYVSMIEGMTHRLKEEIGRTTTVVATGGLAQLFNDSTSIFDAIEPDLTIDGLSLIYRRMKAKT